MKSAPVVPSLMCCWTFGEIWKHVLAHLLLYPNIQNSTPCSVFGTCASQVPWQFVVWPQHTSDTKTSGLTGRLFWCMSSTPSSPAAIICLAGGGADNGLPQTLRNTCSIFLLPALAGDKYQLRSPQCLGSSWVSGPHLRLKWTQVSSECGGETTQLQAACISSEETLATAPTS